MPRFSFNVDDMEDPILTLTSTSAEDAILPTDTYAPQSWCLAGDLDCSNVVDVNWKGLVFAIIFGMSFFLTLLILSVHLRRRRTKLLSVEEIPGPSQRLANQLQAASQSAPKDANVSPNLPATRPDSLAVPPPAYTLYPPSTTNTPSKDLPSIPSANNTTDPSSKAEVSDDAQEVIVSPFLATQPKTPV